MSTVALTSRFQLSSVADGALKSAARFWFVVTIAGQLLFAFAVASFYGLTALRGDLQRWSKFIRHGYVAGDTMGNFAVAVHLLSAVIVMGGGALQLVPRVRDRFPRFHRWNGRVYLLTAVTVSLAGLYMTWLRESLGDVTQHLASTLNVVLILLSAAMALRYALRRDFKAHRRWALRLFLVVSAAWFFRIAFFLSLVVFKGPFGWDPITFQGPLITSMSFGQYLLPLAVLEVYLRAKDSAGAGRRLAMAVALFALTIAMAVGLFAVARVIWAPELKTAYDPRTSIAETLSATIASSGIEQAEKQYRALQAAQPAAYNFDEGELNTLGYQLLRQSKFKEAVRILQLNVEVYPRSSNTYDSLAEAYMDAGDSPQAIANYRKVLELDPGSRGAALMLRKLGAPGE